MCVYVWIATQQSSIPVAILAITLLTATPAAQCEKLSTLKLDRVHRRQTVLHSSSGSIRWYQSDETTYWRKHGMRGKAVSVSVSITQVIFRGTPGDSAPWKRAYPKPLALNPALLGHHLQSGDRGRVSAPLPMWQRWEFLGPCYVISASFAAWAGCVCVCVFRYTNRMWWWAVRGFHRRERNQTKPQVLQKWGKFYKSSISRINLSSFYSQTSQIVSDPSKKVRMWFMKPKCSASTVPWVRQMRLLSLWPHFNHKSCSTTASTVSQSRISGKTMRTLCPVLDLSLLHTTAHTADASFIRTDDTSHSSIKKFPTVWVNSPPLTPDIKELFLSTPSLS